MSFVPKKIVNEAEVETQSECHVNKAATSNSALYSFDKNNDRVSFI